MKRFTLSFLMIILSSFFIFGQTILAVDRDGSADLGFTDCWPAFQAALDANSYTYTYYEVTDVTLDGPDLTTMQAHDIIIWFTGEGWQNGQTMTDNDETNLSTFMDDGGMLFFSGQDFLWDRWSSAGSFSAGDFPYDYFGLRDVSQDIWFIDATGTMDGVAGSLAEGMTFTLQDIFTTDKDGLFIDEMVNHVGTSLFNITDPAPEGIGAVQYELRGHKAVFTTASFAAIVDAGNQATLMAAIIGYFTGGPPPPPEPCEGFDDLTVGGYVADQLGGLWTTWSAAPGTAEDAFVSDSFAVSPDNSFVVEGTTDLVKLFADENLTVGKYKTSVNLLVADGYCGYFNLQKDVIIGTEWGFQVQFDVDGVASVDAGAAAAATFNFDFDTWFNNELIIDLDNDWAEYFVDGTLIIGWQWTLGTFGDPGANTLGSYNFYAWSSGGNSPMAFFDDVCFAEVSTAPCEGFDDLTVGGYVADQLGGLWTTWSAAPGTAEDAFVSDSFAVSPDNSFVVEGTTDLVKLFDDENLTEGKYKTSVNLLVADGYCGYFNLQKDVIIGTEWGFQVQFDVDGVASVDAGAAAAATFNFDFDTWFNNELIIDLKNDWAEYYVDGTLIIGWQWTLGTFGDPGANTLGSYNFYAWSSGGNSPMAFFDDVCFEEVPTADCEGFDDLTVGGYVAEQLGGLWTTWSAAPGTAEDAFVSDSFAVSPDNSFVVEGTTDLVKLFADENLISGKYVTSVNMLVADGFCGYFNLQKDVVIGTEWGFQVQFDVDGVASVDAGAAAAATFNFDFDTWFNNELIIDLSNDWAEYYVDGELIIEWQWTLGTFGDPGARTLGSYNFYAWSSGGNSPMAFFDDVCFEELTAEDCEGFDDLTVGGYVAEQLGGLWTTWSAAPGTAEDAIVSDSFAVSPGNSFVVEGTTDLVKLFDDENLTGGKYRTSLELYVADGFCGYFNLQKDVIIGTEWGFQVQFNVDSVATVDAGGAGAATFDYLPGTWIFNELIIDIDNDWAEYLVDGELIVAWQWTLGTFGDPGANTLGSYNFYAWSSGGYDPMAFFDDVCFEVLVPVGVENPVIPVSEAAIAIYPNPARDYINIVSVEKIIDIRIFNQMGQLVESVNSGNKHITISTSGLKTGMYVVQVRTEKGMEVTKLLIQ